ncbi:MAG: hypothetical protein CMN72_13530 [Sphingomonas sp.]|jgi:hypothetical protein|nr:hypothetical protein [Sphingomonas sp.]
MAQLTQVEMANWAALYAATTLCCAIALALSLVGAGVHLFRTRAWNDVRTFRQALLFLPKAWWLWQRLYLRSSPVIIAIVGSFALTLRWS